MNDFTATHFRFEVEALTTLALDDYTGWTLRGGARAGLQSNFCPDATRPTPTTRPSARCAGC